MWPFTTIFTFNRHLHENAIAILIWNVFRVRFIAVCWRNKGTFTKIAWQRGFIDLNYRSGTWVPVLQWWKLIADCWLDELAVWKRFECKCPVRYGKTEWAGTLPSAFKSTIVLFCGFFSVTCFFLMGWSAFCAFFSRVSAFFCIDLSYSACSLSV